MWVEVGRACENLSSDLIFLEGPGMPQRVIGQIPQQLAKRIAAEFVGLRALSGLRSSIRCCRIAPSQILMRFRVLVHERFLPILQERYCSGSHSVFCRSRD